MKKNIFFALLGLALSGSASALSIGQIDTFQDGTTQGWGGFNPTIGTGGIGGASDKFIRLHSVGGFGSGSNLAMHNESQWVGDYLSVGVNAIECDMRNEGTTNLVMRAVFIGNEGARYTTNNLYAVPLPADNQWHHMMFFVKSYALVSVVPGQSLTQVLSTCSQILLRHNDVASSGGTPVVATVSIDNIRAIDRVKVRPASLTLTEGTFFSGNLSSLYTVDDNRYRFFDNGNTLSGTIVLEATCPIVNTASIQFDLVSSVARTGLALSVDFYNFSVSRYDNVAGDEATVSDSELLASPTVGAGYINSSDSKMRARLNWTPFNDEAPSQDGWLLNVNFAEWRIEP